MLEGWNGGLNFGFGLTRGNSQTKTLALAFNATRTGLHDKLSLYAGSVYNTNDLPAASPHVTANTNKGEARYDRDITPRLFGFVNADFFTDGLQGLNIRTILGGGLGFHAIKRGSTTLDLLGGANYTHKNYTQETPTPVPPNFQPHITRNLAAGTIGDQFMRKLSKNSEITQDAYFYPDFSGGDCRGTFDLGTVTKISKWLGWQNSFGDIYVSNPPARKQKNDIVFTTGLNVTFTH